MNPIASLDGPVDGQVVHHVVPVEGWVLLGGRPASLVEVFVEDRPAVRARRCEPRADLVGAIGGAPPDELAAGFRELVPLGDLARTAGEVTVTVRAYGHDGSQWHSAPVTVVVEVEDDTTPVEIPDPLVAPDADTSATGSAEDRALRVCVFTHSLQMGGGELYLQELLLRLAASHVATFLVVAPNDGPLRAELEAAGIRVHVGGHLPIDPTHYRARVAELVTLLRSWQADAVIGNTLGLFGEIDAALEAGVPVVWAIHESFHLDVFAEINWGRALRPGVRDRLRSALARADAVVFESEATLDLFQAQVPEMRGRCVRYGVDVDAITRYQHDHPRDALRAELGFSPSDRVLLCMGVFQDRKAQLALVHAFAAVVHVFADTQLVLVGNHPSDYAFAVTRSIADLGIGDRVRVVDIHPDTYRWYRAADFMISASDIESLPRSILECMAFGVPAAAAAVFGVGEVVVDGVNGWLFEPRSEPSLLTALRRVLECPPHELAAMSARARADATAFDGQGYAVAYEDLLRDLVAARREVRV